MANAPTWLNSDAQSPSAESFKALRTNLVYSAEDADCRMVVLVTPQADRSAALFAANLGATMACGDKNILLIDGDLRDGALTKLVSPDTQSTGLSDWLTGQKALDEILCPTGVPQLTLLPCGTLCPDPAALFSGEQASNALRSLRDRFDYVIVFAPNVEEYTDAIVLSRLSDGAIVLFSAEKTKMRAAKQCKARLEAVNAPILGAVLNNFR